MLYREVSAHYSDNDMKSVTGKHAECFSVITIDRCALTAKYCCDMIDAGKCPDSFLVGHGHCLLHPLHYMILPSPVNRI